MLSLLVKLLNRLPSPANSPKKNQLRLISPGRNSNGLATKNIVRKQY